MPFAFVHILLPVALPPMNAFLLVYQAPVLAGQVDTCRPLLDFLKVAATDSVADPGGSAVIQPWPLMTTPADTQMLEAFEAMINLNLLGHAPRVTAEAAIVHSLNDLVMDGRQQEQAGEDRAARASREKNPTQAFSPAGALKLMQLC